MNNDFQNGIILGSMISTTTDASTKKIQSDYAVNDSSDPAYIKNRPFYSGTKIVNYREIVETQEDIESAIDNTFINYSGEPVGLIIGESYTVTVTDDPDASDPLVEATVTAINAKDDEVLSEFFSFDCTALYDEDNAIALFDKVKVSLDSEGNPVFSQEDNSFVIISYETAGLTVKVEGKGISSTLEIDHKIPSKYLPDTNTRYYREIVIDLPVFSTQPTYTPASANLKSIFKTDEKDHMFYWVKMVSGSSTDFTLHYTENGTDDPIGGVTFSMAGPPRAYNLVRFKLSEDESTMLMGNGWVVGSDYRLNLPKNLKYIDIDLYQTATESTLNTTYPSARYPLYLRGNTTTSPGYLTLISNDATRGLYPYSVSSSGDAYAFGSCGLVIADERMSQNYAYLTSLNHNHVRVRITQEGNFSYINCLGYTDGVMLNKSPENATTSRLSDQNLKYYDRIPLSSRVRQNEGLIYTDLKLYNTVFQNGDKIILQGELEL